MDEYAHRRIYFRDSTHGLLAWTVASLANPVLLITAIGSIVSGGIQAGATVVCGAASGHQLQEAPQCVH